MLPLFLPFSLVSHALYYTGPKKETRNECEMMKIVRQKMVTSDETPRERRKISLSLDDPTPNQVTDTSSAADSDENAASDRSSAGAANEADAEDPGKSSPFASM